MARAQIVTAIDIGTSSIKGLVVRKRNDGGLELLSQAQEVSEGIRKGVVADIQEAGSKIKKVLEELSQTSQSKIDGVYINLGGHHIYVTSSRGGVAVSRADQRISQEDIERAIKAAQAFSLPPNREILEVWPKEFIVDQVGGIKDAFGMQGVRLEVEILALCGFSPYIKNVTEAALDAGCSILDLIPSPLAAARAVLTPRQKELGVAVVDLGARTTSLAVFEEKELLHVAVFPVGSANITDDIAIGLRCDIDTAEKIKKDFGAFGFRKRVRSLVTKEKGRHRGDRVRKTRIIRHQNLETDAPLIIQSFDFSPKILTKIVEARLADIFDEVNKELKKIYRQELLPAGVVFTGGGALLPNLIDFAKRELRLPCQIGFPQGIEGIAEDPSLSVACGLALEGFEFSGGTTYNTGFLANNLVNKVKRFFRTFVP